MTYIPRYCQLSDIYAVVPAYILAQLTDDSEDVEHRVVKDDVILEALRWAEARIDTIIGKRYRLPLDTIPDILLTIARDGAIYYLYSRVEDEAKARDKLDIWDRWLEKLERGDVDLPLVPLRDEIVFTAPANRLKDEIEQFY